MTKEEKREIAADILVLGLKAKNAGTFGRTKLPRLINKSTNPVIVEFRDAEDRIVDRSQIGSKSLIYISLNELCNGDVDAPISLTFYNNGNSRSFIMGQINTSVRQLQEYAATYKNYKEANNKKQAYCYMLAVDNVKQGKVYVYEASTRKGKPSTTGNDSCESKNPTRRKSRGSFRSNVRKYLDRSRSGSFDTSSLTSESSSWTSDSPSLLRSPTRAVRGESTNSSSRHQELDISVKTIPEIQQDQTTLNESTSVDQLSEMGVEEPKSEEPLLVFADEPDELNLGHCSYDAVITEIDDGSELTEDLAFLDDEIRLQESMLGQLGCSCDAAELSNEELDLQVEIAGDLPLLLPLVSDGENHADEPSLRQDEHSTSAISEIDEGLWVQDDDQSQLIEELTGAEMCALGNRRLAVRLMVIPLIFCSISLL